MVNELPSLAASPEVIKAARKVAVDAIRAGALTFRDYVRNLVNVLGPEKVREWNELFVTSWENLRKAYPQYNRDPVSQAVLDEELSKVAPLPTAEAKAEVPPPSPTTEPERLERIPPGPGLTGVANAAADQVREERGAATIPGAKRESNSRWINEAKRRLTDNHTLGKQLADQHVKEPPIAPPAGQRTPNAVQATSLQEAVGNNMSKKQRVAVVIGAVLAICSALCVPYEGVYVRRGDNLRLYLGYGPFFDPPSRREVCQAIFPNDKYYDAEGTWPYFSAEIITQRIWVELVAVGLVTLAATLVLGNKKKQEV